MKPPCRVCDHQTATHRATNPRETDPRHRTWLICRWCIRQAIKHGLDHDYEPLPPEEVTNT